MISQKFRFSDFSKRFKAIENISAGDAVYIQDSELLDDFQSYEDLSEDWVDSDAENTMATVEYGKRLNPQVPQTMYLITTEGFNTGDYVDKTIASKNLTGYTIHVLLYVDGSALSGKWEFLVASGANAATNNKKQALTVAESYVWVDYSFTIAGMTVDNGTLDATQVIHFGIRCVDDTGNPNLYIARIWYEKAGATFVGIKKATFGGGGGSTSVLIGTPIGVAPSAITANNFGKVILFGPVVSGLSNLISGFSYGVSKTTPGLLSYEFEDDVLGAAIQYTWEVVVGVALNTTEMMLTQMHTYYPPQ